MSEKREAKNSATSNGDEFFLPRSLFVPQTDPRKRLRETVNSVLSDRFMAFVALLQIPIIGLQLAVSLPSSVGSFLYIADWSIILIFIVEYTSKLYLSTDRWQYFRSPWHLLDLAIVVLPFIQYVPLFGLRSAGSPSLLLRLLRLPRVLAVGGRAVSGVVKNNRTVEVQEVRHEPTQIRAVAESGIQTIQEGLTWGELEAHLSTGTHEWLDIHNVSDESFSTLSKILQVSEPHFKSELVDEIYPHIDYVQNSSFIFLQSGELLYPNEETHYLKIASSGFIIICNRTKIISVSRHEIDLFSSVLSEIRRKTQSRSFVVAVLFEMLNEILEQYRSILTEVEIEELRISRTPRERLPRDFLERIYQLKMEVSRLGANLTHFKNLLEVILSKRVTLDGFDEAAKDDFEVLEQSVNYVGEIADGLTESFQSTIELYINQTSFETNRILKILAVITTVGVIPAAVSGMLGTNLLDVPYEAFLWQVVAILVASMVFTAYVFLKLGWLRT